VLASLDWSSFVWGAVVGAIAAFATGFLKKAGEHAYERFRSKLFPELPGPIEVDRRFEPTLYKPGGCSWVAENRVGEFEDKGYVHYPHPAGAPKCFRVTFDGPRTLKEFLMVNPDAEQISA
jgi:hypothetical protein